MLVLPLSFDCIGAQYGTVDVTHLYANDGLPTGLGRSGGGAFATLGLRGQVGQRRLHDVRRRPETPGGSGAAGGWAGEQSHCKASPWSANSTMNMTIINDNAPCLPSA